MPFTTIFALNNIEMKLNGRLLLFASLLVVLATASKLFFAPKIEWSGFSPIIAIALFSGMVVGNKRKSFLYPLVALFLSDVIIQILYVTNLFPFAGFYSFQLLNYFLLLISVFIGWALKGNNYIKIISGVFLSPTIFFIISNFFVWATHGGYNRAMNFGGLIQCFVDGMPFYKNSLVATVIYIPVLIGLYNYVVEKSYRVTLK